MRALSLLLAVALSGCAQAVQPRPSCDACRPDEICLQIGTDPVLCGPHPPQCVWPPVVNGVTLTCAPTSLYNLVDNECASALCSAHGARVARPTFNECVVFPAGRVAACWVLTSH